MMKLFLFSLLLIMFTACGETKKAKKLDAKKLIEQKCATCHNLDMPPTVTDDELAPPMMAISFHVHNFVKPTNESQRTSKAIEFVVDYVQNPSFDKSFCDKDSLKRYGLMPSQKDNLTSDESKAIAIYMFKYFTQQNLFIIQKEKALYDALSPAKKLAIKYRCLGCHHRDKKIVGPSFKTIAKQHVDSAQGIKQSIIKGSKGMYNESKGAVMPSFKDINNTSLDLLTEWILDDTK